MSKNAKRLFSILKCINIDTHLWCISVLCGAILLCVSFFVEPSRPQVVLNDGEDTGSYASRKVIEYSSVLGSLSGIESLEDEQVEEIVDAIPNIEEMPEVVYDDTPESDKTYDVQLPETGELFNIVDSDDLDEADKSETLVATTDNDVDMSKVFSVDEIDALERLVQCEAATEDLDGRRLVANVVLNRVETGIWGDDIVSVIEAPGQFDPVESGAYKVTDVDPLTKKAVLGAISGEDNSLGAVYFQKCNSQKWGNKEYLFRYGSHTFYK